MSVQVAISKHLFLVSLPFYYLCGLVNSNMLKCIAWKADLKISKVKFLSLLDFIGEISDLKNYIFFLQIRLSKINPFSWALLKFFTSNLKIKVDGMKRKWMMSPIIIFYIFIFLQSLNEVFHFCDNQTLLIKSLH